MRKVLIISFVVLMFFSGCRENAPLPEEIKLSWEVVSNEYSEQPKAMTKFYFENNSRFTFSNKNWALYFNQMTRDPLSADNNVEIQFISGDWYVMKPTGNFSLKPGQSVEITTEHSEWIIKETDAPLGPYLILYDKNGNEIPKMELTQQDFNKRIKMSTHNF